MPTYDYECSACGHMFEHFQSMSSRRLRKCPECLEPKLVRLMGAGSGIIFKGSGFYETDYTRASESKEPSKGSSSSKDSGSSDEKSSKSSSTESSSSGSADSKSSSDD